jgi:hypothetical protein
MSHRDPYDLYGKNYKRNQYMRRSISVVATKTLKIMWLMRMTSSLRLETESEVSS